MINVSEYQARRSRHGFILVAVLWILSGLAVLAAVYTLYVVNSASALSVNNDRLQANSSISAALELTSFYLGAIKPEERPTSGEFNFRTVNSSVAVAFKTEAARIDLNMAPPPLLAALFTSFGASPEAAKSYADRIIGWRAYGNSSNLDALQADNPEITAYRNAGLTYNPRQGPFANVQELWLVLGLPAPLVQRVLPHVTVFSGMPTINVMDAAPEVIAALPGMTPERLDAVLQQRAAAPYRPEAVQQLLGPAQGQATLTGSPSVRVTVAVALAKGRRVNAEVVIVPLDEAIDPYRVLSWTDDIDN